MRAVIVGNAPVQEPVGKTIDDCDIICRCNTFEIPGNEHLIGTRTTDWVLRGHDEALAHIDNFDKSELRIIYGTWHPSKVVDVVADYPCIHVHDELLQPSVKWFREQGMDNPKKFPTMGMVIIYLFLKICDPLYLAGFGPSRVSYASRIENDEKTWKTPRRNFANHDFVFERKLINRLVAQGSIVKLENGV